MDDLRADIDGFVAEILSGFSPRIPPAPKVIHDPIWGTHEFLPHEIAIIDTPVLQRLRRIHQTGFSFFTFPSTTHTRFEHSLGAAMVGTRMLESVARRHPNLIDLDPKKGDLAQIRAASLLHDCGHGFASHASEQIYSWYPSILLSREISEKFQVAKASEIISWFIVTSPAFRNLIDLINQQCATALSVDLIADLILGIPPGHRNFLAEILNGPFDVDRVDYIIRDARYSGIESGIDLERFFHDIDVSLLKDGHNHLVLRSTHAIEQLLFTKVHLFVRLYRHQKVLAADGAVQSLVSIVKSAGTKFYGVDFTKVSDFLRITDSDIWGAKPSDFYTEIKNLLQNFHHRILPHRCIMVTLDALKATGKPVANLHKLISLNEAPNGINDLRKEIWDGVTNREKLTSNSIIISFPSLPPLREASQVYVMLRGHSEPITLNSLFRIDEWLTTYSESHWAGYVFAGFECRDVVAESALRVLQKYGIELDLKIATSMRKPLMETVAPLEPGKLMVEESLTTRKTPGLPVLETYAQRLVSAGESPPLNGLNSLIVLHFLTDLVPFLERLERFGLEPCKTWLIRKPYQYQFAHQITDQLRKKKYNLEECTAAEETSEPVRRALLALRNHFVGEEKFIVIEDGGYSTSLLHKEEFADIKDRCIGVVEQTTKGLRLVEAAERGSGLRFPVVAVARSKLKLYLEAGEVGNALAFNLEYFFRKILGKPLAIPTLVVGFGSVGRNLANALAQRGAQVTVFDSDYSKQAEARSNPIRINVLRSLEDLTEFRLIVGTTGTTSLSIDALLKTSDKVILASGSSDRLEFELDRLMEYIAKPIDKNVTLDGFITRYTLETGRSIEVLCDGYPINFILGDGIAKSVIDPILTQLFLGAMLIANKKIIVPGIHDFPQELEEDIWECYLDLIDH